MITFNDNVFRLQTADTEYIFRITKYGHLEHVYYGTKLIAAGGSLLSEIEALAPKRTTVPGGSIVAYDREDNLYCLDAMCLEWSGIGKGDYRYSPCELKMPAGDFVTDFIYESHEIKNGAVAMKELPSAKCSVNNEQTMNVSSLIINMREKSSAVSLQLIYTVFEKVNCITRRVILNNFEPQSTRSYTEEDEESKAPCDSASFVVNNNPLIIRRLLSMSVDMPNMNFNLITFDGDWAREAHRHDRALQYGIFVNESRTGSSSNKHNPGFLLCENGASESSGRVYGFNLVYSGNHLGFAELNSHDLVRVGIGISPHCFEWKLEKGESFETPEAVMTFSDNGFNGLSRNFHEFVNNHIIPEQWQGKERPVLYNSWEPCFFNFNRRKLMSLARNAKKLGMELFVLDDGWFKARDNDKAGLGDYAPNKKKFPRGMGKFARRVNKAGLDFGIWFEPEMVNEDSDLFRAHPEWAIGSSWAAQKPGREAALGRNQHVLDLCNPLVRDYIVESVGKVLDETKACYVKWDMNRHIAEFWSEHLKEQGEFYHRYILGLYDILKRIFLPRPNVLLESCSSGGNRFDLGMLCYSPQIWASDNTDPAVRLNIQGGLSYLYPQSSMGAHVSDAPHQQTLRDTPLSTRFNVASFGCLGYELDLRFLTPAEKKEIKEQVAFYKAYRKIFQYGKFDRLPVPSNSKYKNKFVWLCKDKDEAVAGFFQDKAGMNTEMDVLRLPGFDKNTQYKITSHAQKLYIKRFGGLVKHLLPVTLDPNGFILRAVNRFYALNDCTENYQCSGSVLGAGVMLNSQFRGNNYNENIRLLGDYGSSLYLIKKE